VNGISLGWPPDAATFHKRPSAEYNNALPSGTQRIRVVVTSTWFVTRIGDPAAVPFAAISCTHTCILPDESGAKNAMRRPFAVNAGASACAEASVTGVA
jgi:hypothetical protein